MQAWGAFERELEDLKGDFEREFKANPKATSKATSKARSVNPIGVRGELKGAKLARAGLGSTRSPLHADITPINPPTSGGGCVGNDGRQLNDPLTRWLSAGRGC
eukprot:4998374-Pyramimonas_sp.AAC.1